MQILSGLLGVAIVIIGLIVTQAVRLYRLDKKCRNNYLLMISEGNRVEFITVEKDGNSVNIPKKDGTSKMWTVDKSCIRSVSYPIGSGWRFLKRDISMIELDSEDWEPIYSTKHKEGEIVSSPKLLGTLFNEKVAAAIVGMGKEFTDAVKSIKSSLSPTNFWIGIAVLASGIVFIGSQVMTTEGLDIVTVIEKLDLVIELLGGAE